MAKNRHKGRVLVVAGSDSGGGAGIQGDIKTITALGGYAATAITALTAQNTRGVFGIHPVPPKFVAQQMRLVLEDIGADAIKTGMLLNVAIIEAVAEVLADYPKIPLILDPVMLAKGGAPLLKPDAVKALKHLIPRASLITPNIPEAMALFAAMPPHPDPLPVGEREARAEPLAGEGGDKRIMATALLNLGCKAVLLKGGHGKGSTVTDILATRHSSSITFSSPRIRTRHTHGTGCALASAIATGIAQGLALEAAIRRAHAYVQRAIKAAPGLGKGNGPLGHLR